MSDTAEIERLRKLLSDTNTYYAECISERELIRAENDKLQTKCETIYDELLEAKGQVVKLRAALIDTLASLVASIDLLERGGKKAAPSNKMFEQMLVDYKNSIERGRTAAAALKETGDE